MTFSEPRLPFFVYGTLRRGQRNYRLLHGKTTEEVPATLSGVTLYALSTFPALTLGDSTVIGELMTIESAHYPQVLADLDRLEGYVPGAPELTCMYTRVVRQVTLSDGRNVEAWVYLGTPSLFNKAKHRQIEHGDWCRYVEQAKNRG